MLKADMICAPIQAKVLNGRVPNSLTPFREPGEVELEGGILYKNDISYESAYPNSFFDIWYAPQPRKKGTIVYFHGGGFLFGDKVGGDPLAASENTSAGILKALCAEGYNIISADYCFAPEYRFPVQVRQENDFLHHLVNCGPELGLDMENLILMGSSAGANLVELYGALLTNPDYAKALGVEAPIEQQRVKGIIVDESALDLTGMGTNMELLASVWLGVEPVTNSEEEHLMNAPKWIQPGYPVTLVTSCNAEKIFHTNAVMLKQAIESCGGSCRMFDGTAWEEALHHGFLTQFRISPAAKVCFQTVLDFLEEVLNQPNIKMKKECPV